MTAEIGIDEILAHRLERDSCDSAKASLLIEGITTNNDNLFAGRLGYAVFLFDVDSTILDIQSKSHAP
jgi:hypothetical protein